MKIKTIEQIKYEYSCSIANKESTFNEYISFILFTRNAQLFNDAVNIISRQYSLQFKQQNDILIDRVKELEGMIVAARDVISKRMCNTIDSREFMLLDNIYQESNSIINKVK